MNIDEYATLSNLYRLLSTKTIPTAVIGIGFLFIFSMDIATVSLLLVTILAIPFSVFMIVVLYRHQKRTWITGFFIWMGISFIPLLFLENKNLFFVVLKFAPLLFFVLYTMLLRERVGEWISEIEFERELKQQTYRNQMS